MCVSLVINTLFVKYMNCLTECTIGSLVVFAYALMYERKVRPKSCYSIEAIPVIVVVSYFIIQLPL